MLEYDVRELRANPTVQLSEICYESFKQRWCLLSIKGEKISKPIQCSEISLSSVSLRSLGKVYNIKENFQVVEDFFQMHR